MYGVLSSLLQLTTCFVFFRSDTVGVVVVSLVAVIIVVIVSVSVVSVVVVIAIVSDGVGQFTGWVVDAVEGIDHGLTALCSGV